MKDIDFDELDRAVGSILTGSGTKADNHPAVATDSKTVSAPVTSVRPTNNTSPARAVVESRTSSPETSPSVSIPTRRSIPAVRRSSGRFMDVVHPSSDMKTKTPEAPVSKKAKLAPISADLLQPSTAPKIDTPKATEPDVDTTVASTIPDAPQAVDNTLVPEPSWPDPLDVMGDQSTASESNKGENVSTGEVPDQSTATTSGVNDDQDRLADAMPVTAADEGLAAENATADSTQTPFLTDAKINKRPLGAFGLNEASEVEPPQTGDDSDGGTQPAAELTSTDQPVSQPLPPELQPEAVRVESTEVPEADDTKGATDQPAAAAVAAPVLTQSISPQYQATEDDDDDEQTRSLFDTQDYHQPLIPAHAGTSKGKRIAITVIMTVLLLAVGAAIGYAAYVYNIGL